MKPKILSRYTYDTTKSHFEETHGESMTVENDAMSIQDIIKRQAAGLVDIERKSVYIDNEIEDINKFYGQPLDLTDLQEFEENIVELKARIEDTRAEIEKAQQEQEEPSPGADVGGDETGETAPTE